MKTNKQLGDTLKRLRKALGKTQKELADTLGVSTVYISYVENGSRLPSKKLLSSLYELNGKHEIPKEVLGLWKQTKSINKTSAQRSGSGNSIFKLRSQGLYSVSNLSKLQQKNPENVIYVVGLYHLYKELGQKEQADKTLLSAISQMQCPEDRKWLEAYHFQLEDNETGYLRAIDIMQEALALFRRRGSTPEKEKYSELLFRLALLHYDFGVFLFENGKITQKQDIERALTQFKTALHFHEEMIEHCPQDLAKLDHANIYFWLASLSLYQRKACHATKQEMQECKNNEIYYWKCFIQYSREAHLSNYYFSLNTHEKDAGLFSQEYLVCNISFQALAYCRLAFVLNVPEWDLDYFAHAEHMLANYPVTFVEDGYTLYRYYYNLAHVYSLKAEYFAQKQTQNPQKDAVEEALDLCEKCLKKAYEADHEALSKDLLLPEELLYFQSVRSEQLKEITG